MKPEEKKLWINTSIFYWNENLKDFEKSRTINDVGPTYAGPREDKLAMVLNFTQDKIYSYQMKFPCDSQCTSDRICDKKIAIYRKWKLKVPNQSFVFFLQNQSLHSQSKYEESIRLRVGWKGNITSAKWSFLLRIRNKNVGHVIFATPGINHGYTFFPRHLGDTIYDKPIHNTLNLRIHACLVFCNEECLPVQALKEAFTLRSTSFEDGPLATFYFVQLQCLSHSSSIKCTREILLI
jgi:hypothetical protein